MNKLTIGIDPGISGAIVVLSGDTPIEWMRMPSTKLGTSSRVNGAEISAFLRGFVGAHCYLERVAAMPGQGVTSMFSFGHAAGVVEGVLSGLHIPFTTVTPVSWKKRAGLPAGVEKDAARARAIQLWPAWRALDKKGEGQAMADAALIARFGEGA